MSLARTFVVRAGGQLLNPANETSRFYVTGGTLSASASSYVERAADQLLLSALLSGEYCYVLNSRQMGKSSLSVRTIAQLREHGARTAFVDLTRIGAQNVTAEQWYAGLLAETGRALDLRSEFLTHWRRHVDLPPVQRYFTAIREVALVSLDSPLVVFIDEIDAVRSLSFSADEFFGAVRACYNARTEDAVYRRLTFCLVGAATPADLIVDTRISPFNIGKRVELRDFTGAEAAPLSRGLGASGDRLLARVLYWTGGHPYLTQRLCEACSTAGASTSAGVDTLCAELFFTHSAKESDDNLSFVRNRLLKSEIDVASLLDHYSQMRRPRGVADDETHPTSSVLKLSGICRSESGRLTIRNRIYDHVFDPGWIGSHMPDAEKRRQKAAYRKGLMRAIAVSGVIIIAMAGLSLAAFRYAQRADRERALARQAEGREAQGRTRMEALLYASDMNLAQQALEWGNLDRARILVQRNHPNELRPADYTLPGRSTGMRKDRRGFEWFYLLRLCRGDEIATLQTHKHDVQAFAFSSDRQRAAYGGQDNTVTVWDALSQSDIATLPAGDRVTAIAFSPRGNLLGVGTLHGTVTLWDLATMESAASIDIHGDGVSSLAFSPEGTTLASGHASGLTRLWNGKLACKLTLRSHVRQVNCLAFSGDGTTVASGSDDSIIKLWSVANHKAVSLNSGQGVLAVAFSPNSKSLAAGGTNGTVEIWNVGAKARTVSLRGHKSQVNCVTFSPDGTKLATGSWDYSLGLWNALSGENLAVLRGHKGIVFGVAFSLDGATLLSGSGDQTIKRWRVAKKPDTVSLTGHRDRVRAIAFSSDGRTLASASEDRTVKLWDVITRREIATLDTHDSLSTMAIAPDGKTLATGANGGKIQLWSVGSNRRLRRMSSDGTAVRSSAFSADGEVFAAGLSSGDIRLYQTSGGEATVLHHAHNGPVSSIAFSPDITGKTQYSGSLFSVGDDGRVKVWTRQLAGPPRIRDVREISSPRRLGISPDGRILAVSSAAGFVNLYDLSAGSPSIPHVLSVPSPHGVAFSPDGKTIAISSFDKTIRLWNVLGRGPVADPAHDEWNFLGTQQEMLTLKGHTAPVLDIAFSPDGTLLASAGWEASIRLWQAASPADPDTKGSL